VFYVQDTWVERWSMVLHGKIIVVNIDDDDLTFDTCLDPFSKQMPTNVNREEVDDILVNRNDHDE